MWGWQGIKPLEQEMQSRDLRTMSAEHLWSLHEEVVAELSRKMTAEKTKLEERLHKLIATGHNGAPIRERRPYPKVLPKYRNPKNHGETWAGRGKQPRWLKAQLRSGKKLDEFRINRASD